jgi:hypothetical protein
MNIHAVPSYIEGSVPSTYIPLHLPTVQPVQMQIHSYSTAYRDTPVHKPLYIAHPYIYIYIYNQDSVIRIVTSYWLVSPGFISQQGKGLFLFYKLSRSALGLTQPPTQWALGLFPWGKMARA